MFSPGPTITMPPMVSVFTNGIGWAGIPILGACASATWENATRTVYMPLALSIPCIVRRVWWANGATVAGGATIECGVYSDSGYGPGARLVYGSAVQGTATEVQFVDVTDTGLAAGLYWIGITSSTNSNTTFFRSTIGQIAYDASFRFQEAATALPTTATPVESAAQSIYLCGFSTTASP
jgi:hypothetical protein